jgi:hypothetical protein
MKRVQGKNAEKQFRDDRDDDGTIQIIPLHQCKLQTDNWKTHNG